MPAASPDQLVAEAVDEDDHRPAGRAEGQTRVALVVEAVCAGGREGGVLGRAPREGRGEPVHSEGGGHGGEDPGEPTSVVSGV